MHSSLKSATGLFGRSHYHESNIKDNNGNIISTKKYGTKAIEGYDDIFEE